MGLEILCVVSAIFKFYTGSLNAGRKQTRKLPDLKKL